MARATRGGRLNHSFYNDMTTIPKKRSQLIARLLKSLNSRGMYENAGVKECSDFEDFLQSLNLSYSSMTSESIAFSNDVDRHVLLFCKQ